MLEIGHDDKAHDDEQEPRGYLVGAHDIPYVYLIGVFPGTKVGGDVLGDPYEKGDEKKGYVHRHPAAPAFNDGEIYPRSPKEKEDEKDKRIADVIDKMISEEVYIYDGSESDAQRIPRIVRKFETHETPRLRDVAADRRVHEAAVKGNRRDLEECFFRITPGADERTRLIEFKDEPEHMEEEDYLHFVPRFYFGEEKNNLQYEWCEEEKVVSSKAEKGKIVRKEKQHEKRAREDTGSCLLNAEKKEFQDVRSERNPGAYVI